MAVLRPFCAVRPRKDMADKVAALPYDVMDEEQAREMVQGNPWSFLHVDRAEIDFERGTNPYGEQIYQKAAANLQRLREQGIYCQDQKPCYYIYQEERNGKFQRGVVGCASVKEYEEGKIKKHELTRREKEEDRIRHVKTCRAHTGPIFLTCPYPPKLTELLEKWCKKEEPVYDFITREGVGQKVWILEEEEICEQVETLLGEVPSFYIADGHHRAASAVHVGEELRKESGQRDADAAYEYFLSVVFPCNELQILGYHRIVRDLNGYTPKQFLQMLGVQFEILLMGNLPCRPVEPHCFGMYLDGEWYHLKAKETICQGKDCVSRLDVSILQNHVLEPLLGICNPREDQRISFAGGGRKLTELADQAKETGGVVFVLYPTHVKDLMAVADEGAVMPPKSTWFEPKIYSGLFIHTL